MRYNMTGPYRRRIACVSTTYWLFFYFLLMKNAPILLRYAYRRIVRVSPYRLRIGYGYGSQVKYRWFIGKHHQLRKSKDHMEGFPSSANSSFGSCSRTRYEWRIGSNKIREWPKNYFCQLCFCNPLFFFEEEGRSSAISLREKWKEFTRWVEWAWDLGSLPRLYNK